MQNTGQALLFFVVVVLIGVAAAFASYWWSKETPAPTPAVGPGSGPVAVAVQGSGPARVADAANLLLMQTKAGQMAVYDKLEELLPEVKDAASATAALPKLKEVSQQAGRLKPAWDQMSEAHQSVIKSVTLGRLPDFKKLAKKVLENEAAGAQLKPTLDEITAKLSQLGGGPVDGP